MEDYVETWYCHFRLVRHSLVVDIQTHPAIWGLEFWKPWLEVLSLKATVSFSGRKVTSLLDTSESPLFVDCSVVILVMALGNTGNVTVKGMVLRDAALVSEF